MLAARHLIFTGLDGAVLDSHTHSWAPAEEALLEIERRRVPLVLVTGKTRAEVQPLRRKLGHGHPFITENGGGVFIPHGYFNLRIEGAHRIGRYHCIALAEPYAETCHALEEIAAEVGVSVVGFHQMSAREIAHNAGLNPEEAELARQRDFDEPFFFAGASEQDKWKFEQAATRRGMRIVRRERLWHLAAGSDTARAIRRLAKLYRQARRSRLRSVGLGYSQQEIALLSAVDHPVLLPRPNGTFDAQVVSRLPKITCGSAPGQAGWNAAVLRILRGR